MNEYNFENNMKNNAALKIQICYKNRLELIDKINKHMNNIYSNIYNIINRIQENHELNILSQDRYDTCMSDIDKIYNNFIKYDYPFTIKKFYENKPKKVVKNIVELNDNIEELCKKCGMLNCSDILRVLCGNNWYNNSSLEYYDIFKFYDDYFIPVTSRKLENITDDLCLLKEDNEILPFVRKFHGNYNLSLNETINGADLYFPIGNNAIIISGVFRKDPLNLARMTKMLNKKTKDVEKLCKSLKIPEIFKSGFIKQISLRDFSVLTDEDLKNLVKTNYDELDRIKHQPISGMVKEFLFSSEEKQRRILTLLLLSNSDDQFLAHIIYDMISNQSDLLKAQPLAEEIYRSLHWSVQKMFRVVFKNLEKKKQKRDGDISEEDIPYKQRIELLNVNKSVKNKANEKLKEMEGSKESGAKAQQYLDGLLKIPFGTYKKEPILEFLNKFTIKLQEFMEECNEKVVNYVANTDSTSYACTKIKEIIDVYEPEKITTENQIDLFMDKINNIFEDVYKIVDKEFNSIENNSPKINDRYNESTPNLSPRELKTAFTDNFDKLKKINDLRDSIYMDDSDEEALKRVEQSIELSIEESLQKELELLKKKVNIKKEELKTKLLDNDNDNDNDNDIETEYNDEIVEIEETFIILYKEWIDYKSKKKNYIKQIRNTLNNCVLGHKEAKSQIQRLVAQWMNGKMEGCVFGLRGPMGVGKTSMIREGLSKCLLDNNNNPRPFASLPLGGSTNGAILEGHSYTYLGSTWGRVVDILMETKCMNPIIYIDEIDKISHTEHGREIIGILTHLTDSSQNTEFTDRYFAGIKLDLSKALIVFSYNDIERVDRILRDRITEIEVKPLTKIEKIKITKNYLLPNILETVGYNEEDIILSSELIEFIIEEYTYEAGVRKLKEKVFELIREMNLRRIIEEEPSPLPFSFTKEYIKDVFHKYPKVLITKIAKEPHIGIVNGLYATSAGTGGLTLVEVMKTPTDRKLGLELTGNQGDVMKESMSCAKTLAWNLLPKEIKKEIKDDWEETGNWGLHIHCPEAGMPKDGPSAGITITTAILSRLCGIPVKNTIAMTGEVDLHGKVHAIGGLNSKLEGARRAGVKLVLIPEDNREDYDKIVNEDALETPVSSPRTENIKHSRFGNHFKVIPVKTIFEVIKYALIKNEIDFINFCK
jgi:ATP-dependent Lon protease